MTLYAAASHAAPRVVLVSQAAEVEKSDERAAAWHQLRAELRADGFEVITLATAPDVKAEQAARRTQSFAAIRLLDSEQGLHADVWIQDPDTGKTMLHRLSAQGSSAEAARELALRTAELLGASLLVLSVTRGEPSAAVRSFGLWLGAALAAHPGGLSIGGAPGVGFYWRVTHSLAAELRLIMPILGQETNSLGRTEIDQELGLLGLRVQTPDHGLLFVLASAGYGAYRIGVRGKPSGGLLGRSEHQIVAAGGFGAGVGVRILRSPRFDLSLILREDVIALMPRPVLLFADTALAKAGQPMLTLSGGLEAVW